MDDRVSEHPEAGPSAPQGLPRGESAEAGGPGSAAPAAGPESTASAAAAEHPGVQRVLCDLEGLEQRPVGEHAAAYQDAHERLTRELDSAESRIAGAGGAPS